MHSLQGMALACLALLAIIQSCNALDCSIYDANKTACEEASGCEWNETGDCSTRPANASTFRPAAEDNPTGNLIVIQPKTKNPSLNNSIWVVGIIVSLLFFLWYFFIR
ncbi:hypothetical protein ACFLRF_03010 [Candidatus Altiarchaeota archaeon]